MGRSRTYSTLSGNYVSSNVATPRVLTASTLFEFIIRSPPLIPLIAISVCNNVIIKVAVSIGKTTEIMIHSIASDIYNNYYSTKE